MVVFDSLKFSGKPDARKLGLTPAVLETYVRPGETAEAAGLRWAREANQRHGILILDFEPLPDVRDRAATDKWVADVLSVVRAVRERYPNLRIGHYHVPLDPAGEADRSLVAELDFSCPELYLFPGQGPEQWQAMVGERLATVRKHAKPVLPMVNLHFTVPPYKPISPGRLLLVREHLEAEGVDGVVIWSGSDDGNKDDKQDGGYRVLPWDDEAERAVKAFSKKAA